MDGGEVNREAVEIAVAALRPTDKGWSVILAREDGSVRTLHGLTGTEARKAVNFTAWAMNTQTADHKASPIVLPFVGPFERLRRHKRVRASLSPKRRFDVLERDHHTCRYCGRSAPDVVLHVDHVIPKSAGGSDDMSNLVAACQDCNLGKKDRLPTEVRHGA